MRHRLYTLSGFAGFLTATFIMYYLLLGPDKTIFSISTWNDFIARLPYHEGVAVLCILPLYFAIMIFGGGAVGWFFAVRMALKFRRQS